MPVSSIAKNCKECAKRSHRLEQRFPISPAKWRLGKVAVGNPKTGGRDGQFPQTAFRGSYRKAGVVPTAAHLADQPLVRLGDYTAKWIDSESATIRPEGVLSEVYAPEATREDLAAAVGQVLDILSDDEEEDE